MSAPTIESPARKVPLNELYGVMGEVQFGRPYELPSEGVTVQGNHLPAVATSNVMKEAMKAGPRTLDAFASIYENFGFAVDTGIPDEGGRVRLYAAPHAKWDEVKGAVDGFRRIAGAATDGARLRDDTHKEPTGTRIEMGFYAPGQRVQQYLLVEGTELSGVGIRTRRYLDLVPLPTDPERAGEAVQIVLDEANRFSFEEEDALRKALQANKATPEEVADFFANNDRRTIQSVLEAEIQLHGKREQQQRTEKLAVRAELQRKRERVIRQKRHYTLSEAVGATAVAA